jgi:hypothetical protein
LAIVGEGEVEPVLEVGFGAESFGGDEDEAAHGVAGEVHGDAAFFLEGAFVGIGSDAGHEALFVHADAHFAAHHEAEAAHHPLFFERGADFFECVADSFG